MTRWHYTYAGLQVTSDLEIPEWEAFAQTAGYGEPDVLIGVDPPHAYQPLAGEALPFVSPTEYRFHMPEAGYYLVRDGREIRVTPSPGAGPQEMRLFLLGSAWGALCYQRELFILHASAVQVNDGAVLFCALPGKGKSSLAAWLTTRGHGLVSDDLCRIDTPSSGSPTVYPSTPRFKLWDDALQALGWSGELLERDHFRFDKYLLPWAGERAASPLPITAIYLLEWGEMALRRLTGRAALFRFIAAATYRAELLEPMGQTGSYGQRCLELLRRVPVWELSRPRDVTQVDRTLGLLKKHWTDS